MSGLNRYYRDIGAYANIAPGDDSDETFTRASRRRRRIRVLTIERASAGVDILTLSYEQIPSGPASLTGTLLR